MTDFELLELIGEAEDEYILEAARKPQTRAEAERKAQAAKEGDNIRYLKPLLVAACLLLVVVCAGGGALLHGLSKGNVSEAQSLAAAAEDFDESWTQDTTKMTMQADTAEEEAPAEEALAAGAANQVTALSQAAAPEEPESWSEEYQISAAAADAINSFSYRTAAAVLSETAESACFSPLSLYQTLAVAASGAGGQTQEQLLELLGMDSTDELAEEIEKSMRWNSRNSDTDILQIANSIWLDSDSDTEQPIRFSDSWAAEAAQRYYADVYDADFDRASTGDAIAEWIARKTGNMLTPGAAELNLTSDTQLALINTLWYKAQWRVPFAEADNTEDTFTTADGSEVTCTFMHQTDDNSRAVQGDGYTKSRLFLSTGRIIIVLPDEGVSIDDLLTGEKLTEIFEDPNYTSAKVNWSIPKFDLSNTFSNLTDTLQTLGVTDAFDEGAADFTGITDTPLYINLLQQGTRISVDETGIEAAAYTDLGMESAAVPEDAGLEIDMNLNRPFLYLITADDGSTLFMGIVRNPQS